MDVGSLDEPPDVVGVESSGRELFGQHVAVEKGRRRGVSEMHLCTNRSQRPLGNPPSVFVDRRADGDVDVRDAVSVHRWPQSAGGIDGAV